MSKLRPESLQKWYIRAVGTYFVLVELSLIADMAAYGHRPETWHKIFHVILGIIFLHYGWNDRRWWRPVSIGSGAFFGYVAWFGLIFPDFGAPGLEAFGRQDTLLHGLVGSTGLIAGFWPRKT